MYVIYISDGCDHPGELINGFVIPEQTHYARGEEIKFVCLNSVMVNGKPEAYCTSENVWSDIVPTCVKRGNNATF